MKITQEKIDLLVNATRDERVYLTAKYFKLYCIYYFTKYFTHRAAPFHELFYKDFEDLVYGRITLAAWIAMRDSAKTSIAGTMGLSWLAARKVCIDELREHGENVDHWGLREYVNVDCYDKENAENILFDVVEEFQNNELLIADFGHLYNEKRSQEEVTLKRISKFNTTNRIRYEAHTALKPVRGRKFGNRRPDFILRDDLENAITVRSPVMTEKLIEVMNEGKGGKAQYSSELILGNYIIENGVVGYIMKQVEGSGGPVRFIPAYDKQKRLAWPERHVLTDAEAVEANKGISDPRRHKVSLETKKRELNAGGMRVFETEMLLDPVSAGSPFFTRRKIDELIEKCTEPTDNLAGFHIWSPYNPSHAYAIGADTGKGAGQDHSTSCLIDFNVTPRQQVGSYLNNRIPADQFAYELKREGDMYGTCLVAPEKNSESGGSCLTTLKMIYPEKSIYVQVQNDKIKDKPVEYGWETNTATKYQILNDFRTAIEDGLLAINDVRILTECRSFTHTDADNLGRSRIGHFTNHFDLLIASAIAWEMRKWAKVATPKTGTYEQQQYETPGL